jgi:hypothetical protein
LTELNSARTDFTTLISDLEALEPFYDNSTKIFKRPGKFALSTDEGYTAVLDAISYLQGFTAED